MGKLDRTIPILVKSPWLVSIDLTFQKNGLFYLEQSEEKHLFRTRRGRTFLANSEALPGWLKRCVWQKDWGPIRGLVRSVVGKTCWGSFMECSLYAKKRDGLYFIDDGDLKRSGGRAVEDLWHDSGEYNSSGNLETGSRRKDKMSVEWNDEQDA